MVETLEYIIGFAVSTTVAVFSIFVLSGAAPLLGSLMSNSVQNQVVGAAREAVQHQNASVSVNVNLSGQSISCQHGIIVVAGANTSYSSEVGSNCSFSISGLSGPHTVVFTSTGMELLARVVDG